jgi:hypothetical protein
LNLDPVFKAPPFSWLQKEKHKFMSEYLTKLTQYHRDHCVSYDNIIGTLYHGRQDFKDIEEIPFIPARIFKDFRLSSVKHKQSVKTLTSSGTTSQKVSEIFIDKRTSDFQVKALSKIIQSYIGPQRLPMIIVDTNSVIKNKALFSARGGGITGFSIFGRNHLYLLDDRMQIKKNLLVEFIQKHKDTPILLFGFTFIIWKHLIQPLLESNKTIDLANGILIHSGGWKKLIKQSVDNATFKQVLKEKVGLEKVYNFYGMVEQMGSIFMECDEGYLHASHFSEIIIRNPEDWSPQPEGTEGVIQVLSLLPHSYPGHSILTEDLGTVHGGDSCSCGRKGTFFSVSGRLKKSEVRGCSDTYLSE